MVSGNPTSGHHKASAASLIQTATAGCIAVIPDLCAVTDRHCCTAADIDAAAVKSRILIAPFCMVLPYTAAAHLKGGFVGSVTLHENTAAILCGIIMNAAPGHFYGYTGSSTDATAAIERLILINLRTVFNEERSTNTARKEPAASVSGGFIVMDSAAPQRKLPDLFFKGKGAAFLFRAVLLCCKRICDHNLVCSTFYIQAAASAHRCRVTGKRQLLIQTHGSCRNFTDSNTSAIFRCIAGNFAGV